MQSTAIKKTENDTQRDKEQVNEKHESSVIMAHPDHFFLASFPLPLAGAAGCCPKPFGRRNKRTCGSGAANQANDYVGGHQNCIR